MALFNRVFNKKLRAAIVLLIVLLMTITDILCHQSPLKRNGVHVSPRSAMRLPAVERARKLACIEPQPRAYHLKDLMESQGLLHPTEAPDQPAYLVVKRCDGHSGCCPSPEMMCMPNAKTIYYEELEIQFWSVETKKTSRKRLSVEQHNNCSCEPANQTERETLETRRPRITLLD